MAATRASGTNAVRYGTMRDNVINLTAVMPDGEVVRTGSRARKSSAGYDLTRLLVGSEGTLGVITELTLRLYGIPEAIAGGVCPFPTVADACNATILTIQSGIPVARIELLDALQVKACNLYSKLVAAGDADAVRRVPRHAGFGRRAVGAVRRDRARVSAAASSPGRPSPRSGRGCGRRVTTCYWAASGLRPGSRTMATDVCVPISRLAECVTETAADIARSGLVAPIVGHVGDGNFHVTMLVDMEDAAEVERAEAFVGRLNMRAIAMDGTCTGEHGVGQGKMKYWRSSMAAGST